MFRTFGVFEFGSGADIQLAIWEGSRSVARDPIEDLLKEVPVWTMSISHGISSPW